MTASSSSGARAPVVALGAILGVVSLLASGCSHARSSLTIGSPGARESATPELVVQSGHSDQITGMRYSPDGHLLATSSLDGTVKLWDLDVGLELRTLQGPTGWINPPAFSADGRRVAAGGLDKAVYVWDVATGALVAEHRDFEASVSAVALSPDGQTVVAASFRELRRWQGGESKRIGEIAGMQTSELAFSPDGRRLARGHTDGVELWDTASWTLIAQLPTPNGGGEEAAPSFSPDGRLLGVRSGSSTAHLFEVETGRELVAVSSGVPVDGVGFTRGVGDFLVFRADGATERFSPAGQPLAALPRRVAARAPDGQRPANAHADPFIARKDVAFAAGSERANASPMAVSLDGEQMAEVWHDRSVHRWDLASGRPLARLGGNYDFLGPEFVGVLEREPGSRRPPAGAPRASGRPLRPR